MKKSILLLFAAYISSLTLLGQGITSIPIGMSLPAHDVIMEDISGEETSLSNLAQDNGLLVIFSCNTCPFVIGWEDRYMPLADWCKANNIGFALINSNEAQRETVDGIEKMREHAAEKGYACHYLLDKDHLVADAFGATRTPEVFLFNSEGQLTYKGAIDDNMEEPKKVKNDYLKNALQNLLEGLPANPAETKSVGCTIKRVKK